MSGCADSEPFALRVIGDSMAPEFVDGEIIIVEPTTAVTNGCFVVAQHEGEYILRQLQTTSGKWLLNPVNRQYPSAETRADFVRGRVIAKSNGRGRQNKRYL